MGFAEGQLEEPQDTAARNFAGYLSNAWCAQVAYGAVAFDQCIDDATDSAASFGSVERHG